MEDAYELGFSSSDKYHVYMRMTTRYMHWTDVQFIFIIPVPCVVLERHFQSDLRTCYFEQTQKLRLIENVNNKFMRIQAANPYHTILK